MRTEPSTRLRHWWIAACLLLAMLAGCRTLEPAPAPTLRVMSFNVLVARDIEGPARWSGRRDALVQVIADADPDLLGTQELLREQADFITARLPQYAWFGHGRRGDGAADDEHMGVFYHRERMRLLDSGHFWLSDTPDVPGSITWGTRYPRMASWGLFERIADGKRLYLLNTHMPYRDEDATARERGATLILRHIAGLPADLPVVLVGDFNDIPGHPPHRALTAVLGDAWEHAPRRSGPEGTGHWFEGRAERRLDWVLSRGLRPRTVRHLDDAVDGVLPSDHYPVLVEFD